MDSLSVQSRRAFRMVPKLATIIVLVWFAGCEPQKRSPQLELLDAVAQRNLERTDELLKYPEVNINWRPENRAVGPALLTAAAVGPLEMVELLLKNGADPNLGGLNDMRPLHHAAHLGNDAIIRLLLSRGALVDAKESQFGTTPLMEAARKGNLSTVRLLLDAGADPVATDNHGDPAAKLVDIKSHSDIAALLSKYEQERRK